MNNKQILDLTAQLSQALDQNYDVISMEAVLSVISTLESTTITKEQLETTRLAKYINQLRKRTNSTHLAKRAKSLLKRWREMVGMQSNPQTHQQQQSHKKKIEEKHCNNVVNEETRKDISNDIGKSDNQASPVMGTKKRKSLDDGMHKKKEKLERTKHSATTSTFSGRCDDSHSSTVHNIHDGNAMDVDIDVVDNNTQTLLVEQKMKRQNSQQLSNNQSLLSVQQQQINHCSQRQQHGQTSFANLLNDLNNSSSNSSKLPTNNHRRLSSSHTNVETLVIDQSSNSTPSDILNKTAPALASESAAIMNNHINNVQDSESQCVVIDLQDTNSTSFDLTANNDENTTNTTALQKSKSNQISFHTADFTGNNDIANKTIQNGIFSCVNNSSKSMKKSKREMKRKDRDKNAMMVQSMQNDAFNNNETGKLNPSRLLSKTDQENTLNYGNNYNDDNTPIIVDNNVSEIISSTNSCSNIAFSLNDNSSMANETSTQRSSNDLTFSGKFQKSSYRDKDAAGRSKEINDLITSPYTNSAHNETSSQTLPISSHNDNRNTRNNNINSNTNSCDSASNSHETYKNCSLNKSSAKNSNTTNTTTGQYFNGTVVNTFNDVDLLKSDSASSSNFLPINESKNNYNTKSAITGKSSNDMNLLSTTILSENDCWNMAGKSEQLMSNSLETSLLNNDTTITTNTSQSDFNKQIQLPSSATTESDRKHTPKKRGRKRGSKIFDLAMSERINISPRALLTTLNVGIKRVKTTKELFAEIGQRKQTNITTAESIDRNDDTSQNKMLSTAANSTTSTNVKTLTMPATITPTIGATGPKRCNGVTKPAKMIMLNYSPQNSSQSESPVQSPQISGAKCLEVITNFQTKSAIKADDNLVQNSSLSVIGGVGVENSSDSIISLENTEEEFCKRNDDNRILNKVQANGDYDEDYEENDIDEVNDHDDNDNDDDDDEDKSGNERHVKINYRGHKLKSKYEKINGSNKVKNAVEIIENTNINGNSDSVIDVTPNVNSTNIVSNNIKEKLSALLSTLPKIKSIEEIEAYYTNQTVPCTCKIIEVVTKGGTDTENNKSESEFLDDTTITGIDSKTNNENLVNNLIKTEKDLSASSQQNCLLEKRKNPTKDTDIQYSENDSNECSTVKTKKSIFDLDFDDDEDPLNSLMADSDEAFYSQVISDRKNHGTTDDDIANQIDKSATNNFLNNEIDSEKKDIISNDNKLLTESLPAQPEVNIIVEEDINCPARFIYNVKTQQISNLHIDALHNIFISGVNGNWNHGSVKFRVMANRRIENIDEGTMCKEKQSNNDNINHENSVVPCYGVLIDERVPKDLRHLKLSKEQSITPKCCIRPYFLESPFLGASYYNFTYSNLDNFGIISIQNQKQKTLSITNDSFCNNTYNSSSILSSLLPSTTSVKSLKSINSSLSNVNTISANTSVYRKGNDSNCEINGENFMDTFSEHKQHPDQSEEEDYNDLNLLENKNIIENDIKPVLKDSIIESTLINKAEIKKSKLQRLINREYRLHSASSKLLYPDIFYDEENRKPSINLKRKLFNSNNNSRKHRLCSVNYNCINTCADSKVYKSGNELLGSVSNQVITKKCKYINGSYNCKKTDDNSDDKISKRSIACGTFLPDLYVFDTFRVVKNLPKVYDSVILSENKSNLPNRRRYSQKNDFTTQSTCIGTLKETNVNNNNAIYPTDKNYYSNYNNLHGKFLLLENYHKEKMYEDKLFFPEELSSMGFDDERNNNIHSILDINNSKYITTNHNTSCLTQDIVTKTEEINDKDGQQDILLKTYIHEKLNFNVHLSKIKSKNLEICTFKNIRTEKDQIMLNCDKETQHSIEENNYNNSRNCCHPINGVVGQDEIQLNESEKCNYMNEKINQYLDYTTDKLPSTQSCEKDDASINAIDLNNGSYTINGMNKNIPSSLNNNIIDYECNLSRCSAAVNGDDIKNCSDDNQSKLISNNKATVNHQININTLCDNRQSCAINNEYETSTIADETNDEEKNEIQDNVEDQSEFREWHQVLQLRSFNDELLTILPYVVLE